MSGSLSATQSAASTVLRGFESIPNRLKVLGEHIAEGISHPFAPPVVKIALPMLLDVIEDLRQEIAELRKPCPCEGSGGTPSTSDSQAETPAPVDITAKWPTYDAAIAAFQAGEMSDAEKAAFEPVHAKVVAFAASVTGA